ncbi:MAG: hypothetical protein KF764_15340 [Labilithrix sp.]|nr:hypothetical protein [Labilithrix sp.]MBX3221034.1 hypothetical protein [Labilithrix sp.]
MDEDRIKKAVIGAIDKALDAHDLAEIVRAFARGPRPTLPESPNDAPPTAGAKRLLTRIVLGDILDDTILSARPQDRTFPLRLFFGELSRLLATDAEDGAAADAAFTLASGLNFFFRAPMDGESKMRVGFAVSRQLYVVAHTARLDAELVGRSAPLLAALMTGELERLKFESVDHVKVFDSQIHERAAGSDPTAFSVVRPASFLCRVASNNAVKVKAEVLT